MLYRDFIPRELAPGWLQTPRNAAWLRASGDLKVTAARTPSLLDFDGAAHCGAWTTERFGRSGLRSGRPAG